MYIVDIFEIYEEALYAVGFNNEPNDELKKLFNQWSDVEFLTDFFTKNEQYLSKDGYWGEISIEDAVFRTIDEAEQLEKYLYQVAEDGTTDAFNDLQTKLFKPLSKNDFTNEHIKSKAYGVEYNSWLRIYAIRIDANCYVISGGAIKLTEKMNDIEHLEVELLKLRKSVDYLKEINFIEKDDISFIEIRKDGN